MHRIEPFAEEDEAVREGWFALPHLRAGNLIVAVQPDRGAARDKKTSYHDPDLPPLPGESADPSAKKDDAVQQTSASEAAPPAAIPSPSTSPDTPTAPTRRRLLDATAALLATDPAGTLEQVAAGAGVSRATVYHHFENRDTLLDAFGSSPTA